MQDVFTLVGIVSASLMVGGVFLYAAAVLLALVQNNKYSNLRRQIDDVIADISKFYEPGQGMSQEAARRILATLNTRSLVSVDRIKQEDYETVTISQNILRQVLADIVMAELKKEDAPCSSFAHQDRAITDLARLVDIEPIADEEIREYVRDTASNYKKHFPHEKFLRAS